MAGEADASVRQWLHETLQDGTKHVTALPELSEESVAQLYKIMKASQEEDRLTRWQAREAETRAASCAAEADADILSKCGLGLASMPPEVSKPLDTLSECAVLLGCPDLSSASLFSALCEMDEEAESCAQECRVHRAVLEDMRRQREKAEAELETLRKTEKAEEDRFEAGRDEDLGRSRRVQVLTGKAKQYESMLGGLKEELRSCNVSSSIYHSTLKQDSQKVQEVHSEIRQLQARLAHFQGLPADIRLAKQRVADTMTELDQVEKDLQDSIKNMVVGVPQG